MKLLFRRHGISSSQRISPSKHDIQTWLRLKVLRGQPLDAASVQAWAANPDTLADMKVILFEVYRPIKNLTAKKVPKPESPQEHNLLVK